MVFINTKELKNKDTTAKIPKFLRKKIKVYCDKFVGYKELIPRFFNDYELILKTNKLDANDYKIKKDSIRLNIPINSLFSRRLYFGLTYGKAKFEFKEKTIDNIDVSKKSDTSKYYSVTFGKRYKFTKSFYVRISKKI